MVVWGVQGWMGRLSTQRVELARWGGVEVVGERDEKPTQRVEMTHWVVEGAGVERRPNQGVLRTPWWSFGVFRDGWGG